MGNDLEKIEAGFKSDRTVHFNRKVYYHYCPNGEKIDKDKSKISTVWKFTKITLISCEIDLHEFSATKLRKYECFIPHE